MRKDFNMLGGIVNNAMGQNLYSGDVFVFVNATDIPFVSVALNLCQYVFLRMLTLHRATESKKGGR